MEDEKILDLYWERNQCAIAETAVKYGAICSLIAESILFDKFDAEECVNDTYLVLWNTIPPKRPSVFSAFTAKITRNLAIKRLNYIYAQKRTLNLTVSLSELESCIPSGCIEEETIDRQVITDIIKDFLLSLSEQNRYVFLRRYFYFDSVSEIAKKLHVSESTVKSSLLRSRKKLKIVLEKEGVFAKVENTM